VLAAADLECLVELKALVDGLEARSLPLIGSDEDSWSSNSGRSNA
jgi:hypothetical protein